MHATTNVTQTQAQVEISMRKNALRANAIRRRLGTLCLQVLVFLLIAGSWQTLSVKHWIDPFFFSSPYDILNRIISWAKTGTSAGPLYGQFTVTFEETVISFIIGTIFGVTMGYALGTNKLLSDIFGPYITMLNALPRVVLAPIFVVWFGLGMPSKVALGVTLTFFIVFFNAFQGVREVDRNLVNNALLLGANKRQLARHVIIPSALSWILSSLHTSFGFALTGAVVGEFIGAQKGLGFLISESQGAFDTSGVFAGMVLLSITSLGADWLVTRLERRFVVWRSATK